MVEGSERMRKVCGQRGGKKKKQHLSKKKEEFSDVGSGLNSLLSPSTLVACHLFFLSC